jgi:ribosomal protein S3
VDKLVEDEKIRQYLSTRLKKASVSKIVIERTLKLVTVTINTARPGVIIGKGGTEVDKLREELKKFTGKDVQLNIFEIKRPELDAKLVADSIARQLEGRISFRRAMKMSRCQFHAHGRRRDQIDGVRTSERRRDRTNRELSRRTCAPTHPARRHRLRHQRSAHQDGSHRCEVLDHAR